MKYLNSYKLFESKSMLDSNIISDIMVDIIDLGYNCHVETDWWSEEGRNGINICIYGIDEYDKKIGCDVGYIYPDDVLETIERLVDYLKSEGYDLDEIGKKEVELIKNCGTGSKLHLDREWPKNRDVKKRTGTNSQVTFRFDEEKNKWKVCYSLGLYFRES